jgi:hypothetical protein
MNWNKLKDIDDLIPEGTHRIDYMSSKEFLIWFCGFFDGEGHVPRKRNNAFLDIAQALNPDRPVKYLFNRIKKEFGGSLYIIKSKNPKHLDTIRWRMKRVHDIIDLLKKMVPYLTIRQPDALGLIEYLQLNRRRKVYVSSDDYNKPYRTIAKKYGCSANAITHMKKGRRNYFYTWESKHDE